MAFALRYRIKVTRRHSRRVTSVVTWPERLADSAVDAPWIVVLAGGFDHGGACLRRVMFITRRRTSLATPPRHCPACPGRTMFPFGHCLYCRSLLLWSPGIEPSTRGQRFKMGLLRAAERQCQSTCRYSEPASTNIPDLGIHAGVQNPL